MNKCLKCNKNEAGYDPRYGTLPCSPCQNKETNIRMRELPKVIHPGTRDRIIRDNEPYLKDWIQPWGFDGKPNRDYALQNPYRVKDQYTEDEIKEMDL